MTAFGTELTNQLHTKWWRVSENMQDAFETEDLKLAAICFGVNFM
jgi:hypothetical protein